MRRLDGKVAIVTGAALGLGRATCTRMAEEGAAIAVLDVLEDEGRALAEALRDQGAKARFWACDVSREVNVAEVFTEAEAFFEHIDILVNNAGVSGANKPTDKLTEDEWDYVQGINVKGVFFCTKHVIPFLRKNGGGSIINLSSIYGLVGAGDVPPYHASKGAVRLMSKNDALIYAAEKIRVNSIHPGFIWTPMVQGFVKDQADPAAARKATEAAHPMGHMGDPDDIAWGAVYLASDQAKFVTGSELVIDGGYTAR